MAKTGGLAMCKSLLTFDVPRIHPVFMGGVSYIVFASAASIIQS